MMATYHILSTKKHQEECCTIMTRIFPYPDPNSKGSAEFFPISRGSAEFSRFCQADQQPEDQESCKKAKEPASPPTSLKSKIATLLSTPLPQPPPCGPGDLSSSLSTSSGTPAETSQGWKEMARRFLKFILKKLCFGPSKKQYSKWNKIEPM